MSQPRIVTSYLAHPLWRERRDGVLRVPVCRRLRWYADRRDDYWSALVPSAKAVKAGRRGDFEPYRQGLNEGACRWVRHYLASVVRAYPLVVLLCWEGDPLLCHRRLAFEALVGRPWTPEDEVASPYGGTAEVF